MILTTLKPISALALAFEFNNELDKAIRTYKKIIELDDTYLAAYNNLGSTYMRVGLLKAAVECFKKLVELNPCICQRLFGPWCSSR